MKYGLELIRSDERVIGFEGYFATLIEDVCLYRGNRVIITYSVKSPDDLCVEVEMKDGTDMNGFCTVREAMDWIDAQLAETIDDGCNDWMAYRDEHSLRSWQVL